MPDLKLTIEEAIASLLRERDAAIEDVNRRADALATALRTAEATRATLAGQSATDLMLRAALSAAVDVDWSRGCGGYGYAPPDMVSLDGVSISIGPTSGLPLSVERRLIPCGRYRVLFFLVPLEATP